MSIKNVFDIFKVVKDSISIKGGKTDVNAVFNRNKSTSIRKLAGESILHFPVLASSSVGLKDSRMVTAALEGEYAVLFLLAVNGGDIIDLDPKTSGRDAKAQYIRNYHTNLYDAPGTADVLDSIDRALEESVNNIVDPASISRLNEAHAYFLNEVSEDVKTAILNEQYIVNGIRLTLTEAKNEKPDKEKEKDDKRKFNEAKINHKKVNGLNPLIMEVQVYYRSGENLVETKLQVGIKSVLHTIESSEFHYFISDSLKENNIVFRAIQFTTGEIRFFRDFILNLGKIKKQSKINSGSKTVSKWWHKLSQLSKVSTIKSFLSGNKRNILPSTTMVMTYNDVQIIKHRYGVDVMDPSNAAKLAKIYFLLGLVIVDTDTDSYHFFNELTGSFDTYTSGEIGAISKGKDKNDIDTLIKLIAGRR